jgi:hypothetical protein
MTDRAKKLAAALRFDLRVFPSCWLFATHGGWRDLDAAQDSGEERPEDATSSALARFPCALAVDCDGHEDHERSQSGGVEQLINVGSTPPEAIFETRPQVPHSTMVTSDHKSHRGILRGCCNFSSSNAVFILREHTRA